MTDKTFCELLDEMIADEQKAASSDYEKLKHKLLTEERHELITHWPMTKLLIESIIKDENKHLEMLKGVKKEVCFK